LTQIADGLKGCMVSGDLANRVWSHWGRDQMESRGVRRKIINTVAQAYEAGESLLAAKLDLAD
jgi:hypothetical protein